MQPKCDACDSVTINGVFCHETGCYRAKGWMIVDGEWIRSAECVECGSAVPEGSECCVSW